MNNLAYHLPRKMMLKTLKHWSFT